MSQKPWNDKKVNKPFTMDIISHKACKYKITRNPMGVITRIYIKSPFKQMVPTKITIIQKEHFHEALPPQRRVFRGNSLLIGLT